jgi:hypothetical protein
VCTHAIHLLQWHANQPELSALCPTAGTQGALARAEAQASQHATVGPTPDGTVCDLCVCGYGCVRGEQSTDAVTCAVCVNVDVGVCLGVGGAVGMWL